MDGTIILFEVPEGAIITKSASSDPMIPIVVGALTKCIYFSRAVDVKDLVRTVREVILGETTLNLMRSSIRAPNHDHPSVLRRVAAAGGGIDLLFSLLVPQPESVMVSWNIKDAVDAYFGPFLKSLGNFSSFTVKSQVLYLTSLNVKPRNTGQLKLVSQKDLGLAINPVESQLASHVSSNPR